MCVFVRVCYIGQLDKCTTKCEIGNYSILWTSDVDIIFEVSHTILKEL